MKRLLVVMTVAVSSSCANWDEETAERCRLNGLRDGVCAPDASPAGLAVSIGGAW